MSWTAHDRVNSNHTWPQWRVTWADLLSRKSESRSRVIAFFGLFGVGNIGNEASLSTALQAARELDPAAELVCVCPHPDIVRREHGITAVPIHQASQHGRRPDAPAGPRLVRILQRPFYEIARWMAVHRFLRHVDLVIVPGTGILDDFGDRPRGMPYHLFRWSSMAKLAGKPFTFLSVGAGPITHPLSRFLMKSAVRLSGYCSYRDNVSCTYMSKIGATSPTSPVMPDIVFALARPNSSEKNASGTTIGLGVMSYYGWANDAVSGDHTFRTYIDNMATIACSIIGEGHALRILIGERCDRYAVDALLEAIRLRGGVDTDGVIDEPIESMSDLLGQIGRTDAVIGTRYHNVVGALMMNRPVVSLGYSAKFNDVMTSVGLGRYCHNVEALEPEAVLRDLHELLANWRDFSPAVEAGNREFMGRLALQFKAVFDGFSVDPEP